MRSVQRLKIAFGSTVIAGFMCLAASTASAAPPSVGDDINGKTVYITPGSWLRYSDALVSRVYTTAKATLQVKGAGVCTKRLCPVSHNGVSLWALIGRLDVAKPAEGVPVVTERTLRRGDDGDDVRIMQQALVKKGQTVEPDGKFGRGMEEAVKAFQRKSGLTIDGEIGQETRAKLSI